MPRVAFYTFSILRAPHGSKQVQGFFDRIFFVFYAADNIDGFIDRARSESDWGPYATPRFFVEGKHAEAPTTLSVWRDLESVYAFVYHGAHLEALKQRKEWFIEPEWPTYVAWWVADDHIPTWVEASDRHEYLHDNGPSFYAFDFKRPFDESGQPTVLDKQ